VAIDSPPLASPSKPGFRSRRRKCFTSSWLFTRRRASTLFSLPSAALCGSAFSAFLFIALGRLESPAAWQAPEARSPDSGDSAVPFMDPPGKHLCASVSP